MSDDLAERIVEAAARALSAPNDPEELVCLIGEEGRVPFWRAWAPEARAALAAAVREAGLNAAGVLVAVFALDATASSRRDYERGYSMTPAGCGITDKMERTAALLRALAGIADA